jgi:hypothetical protein
MDLASALQQRSSSIQAALSSTDRAKNNYLEDWRTRTGKTFQEKTAQYQTKLQVATEKALGKTELGTQVSTAAPVLYGIGTTAYRAQTLTAPIDEAAFNAVANLKGKLTGSSAGEPSVAGGKIEMTDLLPNEIKDRGADLVEDAQMGGSSVDVAAEGQTAATAAETSGVSGLEAGATTVGTEGAIELGTGAELGTALGTEAAAASTGFLAPVAGVALAATAIGFGLEEIFGGHKAAAPKPIEVGRPPPVLQNRYSISAILPTRSASLAAGGSTNY